MEAAPLSRLLRGAGIVPPPGAGPDPEIRGVCLDSRHVEPGDLFLAFPGFREDGVRFVPEAVRRGASAVLASAPRPPDLAGEVAWVRVEQPREAGARVAREYFGRPDESLALVGITGTNGKTTVAHLLESIGRAAGRRTGRIGTVGHAVGDTALPAARTTPEAPELYRLLAEMRSHDVELVAMEVSSHSLALGRVEGARFRAAAFLNLGGDHLDFHGTADAYFKAKARLFDRLEPAHVAVLPADDPHGAELARRTRARVIRFGRSAGATVRVAHERCGEDGSAAVLEISGEAVEVRTRLVGRFNLDNVAAAAACALAVDLPVAAVAGGVAAVVRVPGRVEPVDCGQPFRLWVDFAHTGDALSTLLDALRAVSRGRLLVLFGCGGDRDRGKRAVMGRAAAERADILFLTSDNPRGEDPLAILEQVREGVASVPGALDRCRVLPDRAQAVAAAVAAALPGDTVVLAGKGHESTQTIGARSVPMDDRELARAALARAGWTGAGA